MPQNKVSDLKNHLFAALERLDDEDLTPEQLEIVIKKSKTVGDVSKNIVEILKLEVEAAKIASEYGYRGNTIMPEMLVMKKDDRKG